MVNHAKDLIDHAKEYGKVSAKGASGYAMNLNFDEKTGEIIGRKMQLDQNKIGKKRDMMVIIRLSPASIIWMMRNHDLYIEY